MLLGAVSTYAAIHTSAGYEIDAPCSKKQLLRNRSDVPTIRKYLTCNKINKKSLKKIDRLIKRESGFAFDNVDTASFCLAVLEGHREFSEVVFSGNISYKLKGKTVRRDIDISGEFMQSPEKTYRSLPDLSAGELRTDKNKLRLYQETDIGSKADVKIGKSNNIAHLNLKNTKENFQLDLELACDRM